MICPVFFSWRDQWYYRQVKSNLLYKKDLETEIQFSQQGVYIFRVTYPWIPVRLPWMSWIIWLLTESLRWMTWHYWNWSEGRWEIQIARGLLILLSRCHFAGNTYGHREKQGRDKNTICSPFRESFEPQGKKCTVSGWGHLKSKGSSVPDKLRKVVVI